MKPNFTNEQSHILAIINLIVSRISDLIEKNTVFENLLREQNKYYDEYRYCDTYIRQRYSREYWKYNGFRNTSTAIYSSELPISLNRLLMDRRRADFNIRNLQGKLRDAENEYKDAYNSLKLFLNKYGENLFKKIIDYLDIDMTLENIEIDYSDLIIENIMSDFKILINNQIKLPSNKKYRGTITILEVILENKSACELEISKYSKLLEEHQELIDKCSEIETLINQKQEQISKSESSLISRIFMSNEIVQQKNSLVELKDVLSDLMDDVFYNKSLLYSISIEKSKVCYRYIRLYDKLESLIDKLGEKSLKELIQKLNISIDIPEDNYFNEREEMRKELKKWFEEDNKKINSEIEIDKIDLFKTEEHQKVLKK